MSVTVHKIMSGMPETIIKTIVTRPSSGLTRVILKKCEILRTMGTIIPIRIAKNAIYSPYTYCVVCMDLLLTR